jgi:hypothetical protein
VLFSVDFHLAPAFRLISLIFSRWSGVLRDYLVRIDGEAFVINCG